MRDESVRGQDDPGDAVYGFERHRAAFEVREEFSSAGVARASAPPGDGDSRVASERRGVGRAGGEDRGEEGNVGVGVSELERAAELAGEAADHELAQLARRLARGGVHGERGAGGVEAHHVVVAEVHLDAAVLQEHGAENLGNGRGVHQRGGTRAGCGRLLGRTRRDVVERVPERHPLGRGERVVHLVARHARGRGRRGSLRRIHRDRRRRRAGMRLATGRLARNARRRRRAHDGSARVRV